MTDKQWIETHREELRAKHPGKWVAVKRGKVVGVGDSGSAAAQAALDAGHDKTSLFKISA